MPNNSSLIIKHINFLEVAYNRSNLCVTCHFMHPFLISILFLYLFACADRTKNKIETKKSSTTSHDTVSILARETFIHPSDTSTYKLLTCGLYMDNKENVAYKAGDKSDQDEGPPYAIRPREIYLDMVYGGDPTDKSGLGLKEMKYVVDTSTFRFLGFYYFKDRNHIYSYHVMMDGGTIAVLQEADFDSFRVLKENEQYATDKQFCYYRGSVIDEADPKSFKVLDTSYSLFISYDIRHYYDGIKKVSETEIKEKNLDSIKQRNGL